MNDNDITPVMVSWSYGVVLSPSLSLSETELNTHNVTPVVIRTIPNIAPESGRRMEGERESEEESGRKGEGEGKRECCHHVNMDHSGI